MNQPILEAISTLNVAGVDYVIVGGVAVNLHGFTRATLDLDIIARFDRPNVHRLVTALRGLGYSPRTPVDPEKLADASERSLWQQKNMVALAFWQLEPPYTSVDIFIEHPISYDELVAQSVQTRTPEGVDVRICGLRHLIHLKEKASRAKDLEDLRFLYDILKKTEPLP